MNLLEITTVQDLGFYSKLADYGVLGIVAIALGTISYYLFKRQVIAEERLQNKYDTLQNFVTTTLQEQNNKMITVVEENTRVINEFLSFKESK